MVSKYVLGPSHIAKEYLELIQNEIDNNELFDNCVLDGYNGIPIWSNQIYMSFKNNVNKFDELYWIVSDYKFNNSDYQKLVHLESSNELFLDSIGYPNNVSKLFLEPEHIKLLGDHSLKVIDHIIQEFPNIKLIFWCLYKRTKANKKSSYPTYLWYDKIKKKYKNNIIDIDLFTTPDEFNLKIIDEGAHPNKEGYILLNNMINSKS